MIRTILWREAVASTPITAVQLTTTDDPTELDLEVTDDGQIAGICLERHDAVALRDALTTWLGEG